MPIWLFETGAAQSLRRARIDAGMNGKVFTGRTRDGRFIAVKGNDQNGGRSASPALAPCLLHRTSRGLGLALVNDDFKRELALADK